MSMDGLLTVLAYLLAVLVGWPLIVGRRGWGG